MQSALPIMQFALLIMQFALRIMQFALLIMQFALFIMQFAWQKGVNIDLVRGEFSPRSKFSLSIYS